MKPQVLIDLEEYNELIRKSNRDVSEIDMEGLKKQIKEDIEKLCHQ